MKQSATNPTSDYCYWTSRLIETERKYVFAANADEQKIYAEMVSHYEKMAALTWRAEMQLHR